MKKIILCAVMVISLSAVTSFAQTNGTANLNITLSDVLSLTVTQPADLDVNFDSAPKYSSGIPATALDHLVVVSSRGFVVKAISGAITGPSSLTAASVKISTAIGSTNNGNTAGITYASDLVLPAVGGTAAAVVTSTAGSWSGSNSANKFNVTYNIGSGGQYAGKTTGVNLIPVVYTITQP